MASCCTFEIVQTKDYSEDTKDALFERHEQEYRNVPKKVLSDFERQSVIFDTIEVSQNAIIIRASDSEFFNLLRKELTSSLTLPQETKNPPDVTHSTIARFSKEVDLNKIQQMLSSLKFEHREDVDEFRLLTDLVPPDFNHKTLEVFSLK